MSFGKSYRLLAGVCTLILPLAGAATSFEMLDGSVTEAFGTKGRKHRKLRWLSMEEAPLTGGTFDLADGALSFSIDAGDITLDGVRRRGFRKQKIRKRRDRGIAQLVFSGVTYSALDLDVAFDGSRYVIADGSKAQVSGSYAQDDGAPADFALDSVEVGGSCAVATQSLECELVFGSHGFDLRVGRRRGRIRHFEHRVVAMAPEPSTGLLVALGLGVLATRRRRLR